MASLEAPRLRLTPCTGADEPEFIRLFNHPQVRRYLWDDRPVPPEDVTLLRRSSEASFVSDGFGIWSCVRAQKEFLGCAGLRFVGETSRVELLYAFDPARWGKGYATEATTAILSYAFGTLGLPLIEASTHPDNTASLSLLRRLGMRPVRTDKTGAGSLQVHALSSGEFTASHTDRPRA